MHDSLQFFTPDLLTLGSLMPDVLLSTFSSLCFLLVPHLECKLVAITQLPIDNSMPRSLVPDVHVFQTFLMYPAYTTSRPIF